LSPPFSENLFFLSSLFIFEMLLFPLFFYQVSASLSWNISIMGNINKSQFLSKHPIMMFQPMGSIPSLPVLMLMASSTGEIAINPSPLYPVLACFNIVSLTLSTQASVQILHHCGVCGAQFCRDLKLTRINLIP